MLKIILASLLSVVALGLNYSPEFEGRGWNELSAADKEAALYKEILADTTPSDWVSTIKLATIFATDMNITFDAYSDDMPAQGRGLFRRAREKLIHTVGAILPVEWKTVGNSSYTGIFESGSENGFMRFSAAKSPEYNAKDISKSNVAPGIGIKFNRDGVHSANFVAMLALTGQDGNFNFAEHDFTNHVPDANDAILGIALRTLKKKFMESTNWANAVGLSDFAGFDSRGTKSENPVFPWRLVLHPSQKFRSFFSPTPVADNKYYVDQISHFRAGQVIYHVYAERNPGDSEVVHIADIIAKEHATGSKFGDKFTFFRHTRIEDDFEYRPEWVEPADAQFAAERAFDYAWTHPDLPFDDSPQSKYPIKPLI